MSEQIIRFQQAAVESELEPVPQGLSVAIVLYNTSLTDVWNCVASLSEAIGYAYAEHPESCQIYLVDNSESAHYAETLQVMLSSMYEKEMLNPKIVVKTIISECNQGYGAANNIVLAELTSEFHLVLNPDTVLKQDTIAQVRNFLLCHPEVGMVVPQVLSSQGESGHVVKSYPSVFVLFLRYAGLGSYNKKIQNLLNSYACSSLDTASTDVELAGGCFFFLRTNTFKKLEGFDSKYFLYFEDFDFCLRLREDSKIAYEPAAKITHGGGDVGRKAPRHHFYFIRSAFRFFSVHGWRWY